VKTNLFFPKKFPFCDSRAKNEYALGLIKWKAECFSRPPWYTNRGRNSPHLACISFRLPDTPVAHCHSKRAQCPPGLFCALSAIVLRQIIIPPALIFGRVRVWCALEETPQTVCSFLTLVMPHLLFSLNACVGAPLLLSINLLDTLLYLKADVLHFGAFS